MGKYYRLTRQTPPKKRPWEIHPIWRGFGCLFLIIGLILVSVISHFMVGEIMEKGWFEVPVELRNPLRIPGTFYFLDKSRQFFKDLVVPHFYADLILAILLLLFCFALLMIVYSIVYAIIGPSRYGPLDSPPIRRSQIKRRK